MAHGTGLVDQEGTAESYSRCSFHVIGLADGVFDVGHHRIAYLADAAIIDRCVFPGEMGELRVDGNTDDFGVTFFEFLQAMIEGNQFGRADKGKIKRPEEYN